MSEIMEDDEIRQVLPARGAAGGASGVQLCCLNFWRLEISIQMCQMN